MWHNILFRTFIALNWTLAGLSLSMAIYGYGHMAGSDVWGLYFDRMKQEGIEAGSQPVREKQIFNECIAATKITRDSGRVGWWVATIAGTVNALGLIVLYRMTRPRQPAAANADRLPL